MGLFMDVVQDIEPSERRGGRRRGTERPIRQMRHLFPACLAAETPADFNASPAGLDERADEKLGLTDDPVQQSMRYLFQEIIQSGLERGA
ncbi:hypothetical protein JZ751_009242 [Albula glossodonta]|uniref:Uncharacterized protein n=1 Tax=Albula glossodonta TaxID=121402 RepID=A0A8T2N3K5_9TELE|nr:hypothetical protein JZ751_009242 [Albula glossodonta]